MLNDHFGNLWTEDGFPRQRIRSRNALWLRIFGALSITALPLAVLACANPHAILQFSAPPAATAGIAFTLTVTATVNGSRDTVINSRMHFKSTDPAAILPPDYYFTTNDAGSHTFLNGFTLVTPGEQTISASIYDATGINGSAIISVIK